MLWIVICARRMFAQLGAAQEISSCDLNIGWQYLQLNRYAEAYERFADAAATAAAMGMQTKAANCFMNMGMALERQGHYASALAQFQRARVVFARETMRDRLIELDLHLGLVHFQLGEYASALRALNAAYAASTRTGISSRVAQSELYRARVWLAQKKHARARQALRRARAMFRRNGQTLMVALCDRQLAETENNARAARRRLASGQRHFAGNGMVIDAALCDVAYAELAMERRDWCDAETSLRKADAVLRDSFPEHHARVLHGLARVALAQHNWRTALDHYAQAAQTLAQLRGGLALETLSNSFFAARAQVIQEGLECARQHHAATHALALIEASKAQSFLGLLDAPARESKEPNEHVRALEERERTLSARLIKQRRQLIAPAEPEKSAQRDVPLADEDAALRALRALTQEYEHVAQELRLARRGLKANPALAPFALDEFRACANAQWGDAWTALDYFFANGKLYIVCADATGVTLHAARWTQTDRFHLAQATTNHPQLRELIYNGTLNGHPAPAKNSTREYLAARLLPDALRAKHKVQTLIVSPHAQLHQLPFQALEWHGAPLLEHFTCVYAPNLQTLVELARHQHPGRRNVRALICGAEDFLDAPALAQTRAEVANLARTQPRATTLWQNEATRTTLMQWNERGALARYDVLHFATHALLEPRAPHASRLLLADGVLNVLELTAWKLDARLVTLSACSSATGKGGSGDEILGLAHAFFYAGARAVVASLSGLYPFGKNTSKK